LRGFGSRGVWSGFFAVVNRCDETENCWVNKIVLTAPIGITVAKIRVLLLEEPEELDESDEFEGLGGMSEQLPELSWYPDAQVPQVVASVQFWQLAVH